MTTDVKTVPLLWTPGIQRDGTVLEVDIWSDGQWVRFQRSKPRKMRGYKAGNTTLNQTPRTLYMHWQGTSGYLHSFYGSGIDRVTVDAAGNMSAITNRTPAGFTPDTNFSWTADTIFDNGGSATTIVAAPCSNLQDIGAGSAQPIYYGDATATTPLLDTGQTTDGGIVVLQPFVFKFGGNGLIAWSQDNQPTSWTGGNSGSARVAGSKIVAGLPIQASSGPSGIFLSLNSVILATFTTGTSVFQFRTLTNQVSVLAPKSFIEANGRYFWMGANCFYMFDGRVTKLINTYNQNYFFDGLNRSQAQKIWSMFVPEFGEIWWFYPRGANTECSDVIILNLDEWERTGKPVFYDTVLSRSAGFSPRVFRYPLMTDTNNPSTVWQHEYGTDVYNSAGVSTAAINSYIESSPVDFVEDGVNRWSANWRLEPDMLQTGDMTFSVIGQKYPRSPDSTTNYTLSAGAEKIDFNVQNRYPRFKWLSNVAGGDYSIGKCMLHMTPRDGRQ